MLHSGQQAPPFEGFTERKGLSLVVFFATDCPTCHTIIPYLNSLADSGLTVFGISQDPEQNTDAFRSALQVAFPVLLDPGLRLSRLYDPEFVPAQFLIDGFGQILEICACFDKAFLNGVSRRLGLSEIAPLHDGNPALKPGCSGRQREPEGSTTGIAEPVYLSSSGAAATRLEVDVATDAFEFCRSAFHDPLPVIPPEEQRVARMLAGWTKVHQIVGRVPPFYGEATVEKIAANAVMAGCEPGLMPVLIPLVRAVCDERFNAHGVQATTHFAAPLVIVSGPVRSELGFHSGQNLFSNTARANSTLGRALQLILVNLGGARPDGVDMSALGNPGKFCSCIAENEEGSPWEPFVDHSAVTLFAAEPPRGVSEHSSRTARGVLRAISYALATIWSYRFCGPFEAVVVIGLEHARTIARDGFSKMDARNFLFENTGVPVREYDDETGEGTQFVKSYERVAIRGEECYRKFSRPEQIKLIVAGGGAGKFSAVIGSWSTGTRGSQMVTYPIEGNA